MKKDGQRLVCFALETNDETQHAEAKLKKKMPTSLCLTPHVSLARPSELTTIR